jgi:hypothetical protein
MTTYTLKIRDARTGDCLSAHYFEADDGNFSEQARTIWNRYRISGAYASVTSGHAVLMSLY